MNGAGRIDGSGDSVYSAREAGTPGLDSYFMVEDSIETMQRIRGVRKELIRRYIVLNYKEQRISLKSFIQRLEQELIEQALRACVGHQRNASVLLGLKASCLSEKLKKYRIQKTKHGMNGMSSEK